MTCYCPKPCHHRRRTDWGVIVLIAGLIAFVVAAWLGVV